MASSIDHKQLRPFGIEVKCDIAAGVDDRDKGELRHLYALDGLIVIRNQQVMSMDDQLEFSAIFGPVLRKEREHYIISNVREGGLLGNKELLFHNDASYISAPYLGGSLHALDAAEDATATRFASGLRAYQQLPRPLRERIDRLNALHVTERATDRRTRLTDSLPSDACAVHAVVGRQRGTGRPYLFVNEDLTACLIGMSDEASDKLLEELFSYLYAEDNIYDHEWKRGDIVVWDNLALQHARRRVSSGARTLQRANIAEFGYWDQYPAGLKTYQDLYSSGPKWRDP